MAEPLHPQKSHAEGEKEAESQLLERYKKQMAHTWDAEIEQQIHGIATGGEGSTQERCASYKHAEATRTLENKRLLVPVIVSRKRERATVRGPIAASEQRLGKAVAMREILFASPSHKTPEGTAERGQGSYMYRANTALISVAFPINSHRGVLEEDEAPSTSTAMLRGSSGDGGDGTHTANNYFRSQRARAEADLRGSYAPPITPLPLPQPVTFGKPTSRQKLPRRHNEAEAPNGEVGTVNDEPQSHSSTMASEAKQTANDAHRADSLLSPFFRHTPLSMFAPSSVTFQQKRLEKQTRDLLLADEERGRLRDRANGIDAVTDICTTPSVAVTKEKTRGESVGCKELHSLLAAKRHQNTGTKEQLTKAQQCTVAAPHLAGQHLSTLSAKHSREDRLIVSADVYDALAAMPLPTRYEDMVGVAATALESNLYLSFADKERQDAEQALLKRQGEVEQSFKRGWMSFIQKSRAELRPDAAAIASLFIGFRVALAEIHAHLEHDRAKTEHAKKMQMSKRRESNLSSSTASPTRGREDEQRDEVSVRPSLSVSSRSPFMSNTQIDATHNNDTVLLNTSLVAGLTKSENENENEGDAWGSSNDAFGDFVACKDPVERCRAYFEANDWLLRRDGYLWLCKKEGSNPSSVLWVKQQTFSTPLSFYAILSAVCPKSAASIGESLAGLITGSTEASSLPLDPLPMGVAALKASAAVLSDSEGGGGDGIPCRTTTKRPTLSAQEAEAEERTSAGKRTPVSAALCPVSGHVRGTNLKTSPSKKGLFHRSVSRLQGALHVAPHSPIVPVLRLDESQLSAVGDAQEGSSPQYSSPSPIAGGPSSSQMPSPSASSLGLPRLASSPFKSVALSTVQTNAKLGLRRSIRQPSEFVASTTTAAESTKRKNNSLRPPVVPSYSEERTNAHQASPHRFLPPLRSPPGGLANSPIALGATKVNATPPPQPPLASGLGAILAQGSLRADGPLVPPPVDLLALFEQFSDTKSSFIQKFGPPSQQSLSDSVPLSGVSRRRSSRRLTLSYNEGRLNNSSFGRNALDLGPLSPASPANNLVRGAKNRGSASTNVCQVGGDAFTPIRATLREQSKGGGHTLSKGESKATGAGREHTAFPAHLYLESTLNRSFAFSDKSGTAGPSDSHALTARSLLSSAAGADREKEKERGANMMSGAGLILMSLAPNFADEEEGMPRIDALFERNSRIMHPCTLPKALEAYFTVLFPRLASFRPQSDKLPGLVKAYDADKDGVLSASEFASMIMKERFFRYKLK